MHKNIKVIRVTLIFKNNLLTAMKLTVSDTQKTTRSKSIEVEEKVEPLTQLMKKLQRTYWNMHK